MVLIVATIIGATGIGIWAERRHGGRAGAASRRALPLIEVPGPYLLLAAMPCGINTMVVGHAYGLDLRIAAGAVAWSTAIAVAAIVPISIAAG